jgi:hypothetical protein
MREAEEMWRLDDVISGRAVTYAPSAKSSAPRPRRGRSPSPQHPPSPLRPRRRLPSRPRSPSRPRRRSPSRSRQQSPSRSRQQSPSRSRQRSPSRPHRRSPSRHRRRPPSRHHRRSPSDYDCSGLTYDYGESTYDYGASTYDNCGSTYDYGGPTFSYRTSRRACQGDASHAPPVNKAISGSPTNNSRPCEPDGDGAGNRTSGATQKEQPVPAATPAGKGSGVRRPAASPAKEASRPALSKLIIPEPAPGSILRPSAQSGSGKVVMPSGPRQPAAAANGTRPPTQGKGAAGARTAPQQ